MTKLKTYCVHVYERPVMEEEIKARSAEEAEEIARGKIGGTKEIDYVEVMITCQTCSADNDHNEEFCGDCGEEL